MPASPRRSRGFTLIEVAIVLVIIGLLLGGILRAQELITQGQIRSVATELQSMQIAYLVYTDRYRALPGDDPGAFDRWGGAVAAGDGNRRIDGAFASQTPDDESRLFWAHLRAAGLVAGAGQDPPFNALRGIVGVQTGDGAGGTVLGGRGWLLGCSSNLPGRIAIAIDSQFDDGDMTDGALLGQEQAGVPALQAGPVSGAYLESVERRYIVCRRF
jgi:prepilin-type N-terminal cleavage/methylation domain-containing protein